MIGGFGGNGYGKQTQTAGTVINRLLPPNKNGRLRVTKVSATASTTAHTLTALKSLGRTTASSAAASGQAIVNFAADPGAGISNAIAANDFVAIRESDATRVYKVSSVSTLAITMTTNIVTGVAVNADIWFFGVAADTDPSTGEAHQGFAIGASAQTVLSDAEGGVIATPKVDEPILLQDNNATAAGSIDQVSWTYTRE